MQRRRLAGDEVDRPGRGVQCEFQGRGGVVAGQIQAACQVIARSQRDDAKRQAVQVDVEGRDDFVDRAVAAGEDQMGSALMHGIQRELHRRFGPRGGQQPDAGGTAVLGEVCTQACGRSGAAVQNDASVGHRKMIRMRHHDRHGTSDFADAGKSYWSEARK